MIRTHSNRTSIFRRSAAVLLLAGATAMLGACMPGPDDAGEYRQSVLRAMAWHFQTLGGMAGGDIEFDEETFERKARIVATLSELPWEGFEQGNPDWSDAKSEIWDEWDDFMDKARALENEAGQLAEVAADDDRDAMREQFQAVRETCQDCHERFRK